MSTSVMAPVTLEEVRESFVQAESSLIELTDALKSLRSSGEQFDDARGELQNASQRLLGLADQLTAATQGIAGSVELLRQGIGVLEKSEPARILSALEHLGNVVDSTSVALQASTDRLTQDVHDASADLGKIQGSIEDAESRGVARVDALEELLTKAAEVQATHLAEATRGVQALSRELGSHSTALGQARDEATAGRRWMLAAIIGTGTVIVSLQLLQLLR